MYSYNTGSTDSTQRVILFLKDCERFLSRFRSFKKISLFIFMFILFFTSMIHRKANGDSVVHEDGGVKYKRLCCGVDAGYR